MIREKNMKKIFNILFLTILLLLAAGSPAFAQNGTDIISGQGETFGGLWLPQNKFGYFVIKRFALNRIFK